MSGRLTGVVFLIAFAAAAFWGVRTVFGLTN